MQTIKTHNQSEKCLFEKLWYSVTYTKSKLHPNMVCKHNVKYLKQSSKETENLSRHLWTRVSSAARSQLSLECDE